MPGQLRSPSRSDVILSACFAALCVAELFTNYAFEHTEATGPSIWHLLLAVTIGAALAWRRVHPNAVAVLVSALMTAQALVLVKPNGYGEIIVMLVALYGLTAHARSWRSASVAAAVSLGFVTVMGVTSTSDPVGETLTGLIFAGVVLVSGAVVHRHRRRADDMLIQRDQAEARSRKIAAEERARIARELHDVVAHGMSVVVLQARGGRRMVEDDPQRATRAFDEIDHVASDCLDEMRRLLGILRAPEGPELLLTPQPRLRELERLVAQAQASGATVNLVVEGDQRELSPSLELSGYRIAQEALTNSLKHAPGSATRVCVEYGADALAIAVTDDGPGMGTGEGGHGLIGIRERVELFGGTFRAGSRPDGGFGVQVWLPLSKAAV